MGALLHDLCHVPLGHTIEDDLKVLVPHDKNQARFQRLWSQIDVAARVPIQKAGTLEAELQILIWSKVEMPQGWKQEYPFVEDIVGKHDLVLIDDYLSRDHHHAGLPDGDRPSFFSRSFLRNAVQARQARREDGHPYHA